MEPAARTTHSPTGLLSSRRNLRNGASPPGEGAEQRGVRPCLQSSNSLMWTTSELAPAEFQRIVEAHNKAVLEDEARLQFETEIDLHKRVEVTLRERARRFRELLEALPAAVYTTDAEGRITFYNQAAVEMWGCRPELGQSQWCGSWRLYWPDGRPMRHDECPMAIALKENRAVRGAEAIAERPDGSRVHFIPYPTPLRDSSGLLVGGVNMLVDITHRKEAEERVMALAGE